MKIFYYIHKIQINLFLGTLEFGGRITMGYDYNRLITKLMPNSGGMDLYDIQYTYGYKGDGKNGAGRIVTVEQGQTFKVDHLKYDELGQVAEEFVQIEVPVYGPRDFLTTKFYDSFGRILEANYPDGDKVEYDYTDKGELYSVKSTVGGISQDIITSLSYNGYGQISQLSYGNGTVTNYTYDAGNSKKLTTLMGSSVTGYEQGSTTTSTLLDRDYVYNKQGMVSQLDRDVAGSLLSTSGTVSFSDQYGYDNFGRFTNHEQFRASQSIYTLGMEYNKAGGITVKDGTGSNFMNAQELNYNLHSFYNPMKPHQLEVVEDADNGIPTHFEYNTSGSIKVIEDPVKGQPQIFFWNEEQQLTGVSNEQGIHQYIYDYKGERIMKSSVLANQVYVNDQTIDEVYNLEPYTVYVNPYYVVTGLINGDKVSKHYYMNTQRVATDITINYDPNQPMQGSFKTGNTQENDYISESIVLQELNVILTDLDKKVLDQSDNLALPTIESYYPDLSTSTTSSKTGSAEAIGGSQRIIFWYHPDYLGNVDLVTDIDGNAYEFFMYNPWGEQMHHWNANTYSFSSPYRFNGKELDPETGLAYYGARYYQNKLSVWLSVDPHAEQYPSLSPYSAFANNPLIYVDPDGRDIILAAGLTNKQKLQIIGNLQKLTNDRIVYKTLKDGTTQVKIASLGEGNKTAGTRLIRRLNSSDNTVTIDVNNSLGNFSNGKGNKAKATNYTNASNGKGSDAIVSFDPSSNPNIMTEDPKTGNVSGATRPNEIGLGHELIHAEHYMDGDYSPSSQKASHTYKDATGKTVTQTYKKEELRTVGLAGTKKDDITENQIRKEQKLNKRGAY